MVTDRKHAIVLGGLLCGLNDEFHFLIQKILNDSEVGKVDIFCHTWDIHFNLPYITALQNYVKKEKDVSLYLNVEKYESPFSKIVATTVPESLLRTSQFKFLILGYSLHKAISLMTKAKLDDYGRIYKVKVDVGPSNIKDHHSPIFNIRKIDEEVFEGYRITSHPILDKYSLEDCIFAQPHYNAMCEKSFLMYPKVVKKVFLDYTSDEFLRHLFATCYKVVVSASLPGFPPNMVQGPVMWKSLFDTHDVPVLPMFSTYGGGNIGYLDPPNMNIIRTEDNQFYIKDKEKIKYIYRTIPKNTIIKVNADFHSDTSLI